MITVKLKEIKEKFNDLINERDSRENISNWASKIQNEYDDEKVILYPIYDESKILDGLEYLMGVDLLDLNGEYLHCTKDFIEAKEEAFGSEETL